ncbi:EAL domain-containing protein [Mycobacterium sp. PDNC021]|uniref:EAL domain-containing protein n=1 Tax=Mycobacterium sp. PDNC021 TaxID=3391399 RepID=UPI003AAA8DAE
MAAGNAIVCGRKSACGYSTLSYLRDLPVDEVKLDRQSVASILDDKRIAEIVHTVVTLAHNLGAGVVAEGVENHQTVARLQQFNCDIAQGYLFSPPIAFSDVLPWLRRGPGMSSSATRPVGVGC